MPGFYPPIRISHVTGPFGVKTAIKVQNPRLAKELFRKKIYSKILSDAGIEPVLSVSEIALDLSMLTAGVDRLIIKKKTSKTARSVFFWPLGCTRFFPDLGCTRFSPDFRKSLEDFFLSWPPVAHKWNL